MLELEVLVGELLTVDGLAASALRGVSAGVGVMTQLAMRGTYVAAGEVTTLEHKVRNDTVELGTSVSKALLAGAESTEVLGGLGDDIVEEVEVDAAGLLLDGTGGGDVALGVNLDLGAPAMIVSGQK